MTEIENTRNRNPFVHLAGAMGSSGLAGYIGEMESAGQSQLVASCQLPKDGPWDELAALGFVRGDDVDDLFCQATLPDGWRKEGSDHAMWSHLVDERGIKRVAVFYKAAFYDRSSHMSLTRVGRAVAMDLLYDEATPTVPPTWVVLTDDEKQGFWAAIREMEANAERYPDIYGKHLPDIAAVRSLGLDEPATVTSVDAT